MKYGLIGKPLGHSYSREIHRLIADYDYELKELDQSEVGKFLQDRQFAAINVTIPYKQTVMPYLDFISDDAKNIGAVNTIVNVGGKLCGYNTDFLGIARLSRKAEYPLKAKKFSCSARAARATRLLRCARLWERARYTRFQERKRTAR